MDSIDGIRIEADEDGFELVLHGDFVEAFEEYLDGEGNTVRLRLQPAAFEFAGSQGLRELLAWRAEGEQARRDRRPDDSDAYAPDDPKSPGYSVRVSAAHDQRPDR